MKSKAKGQNGRFQIKLSLEEDEFRFIEKRTQESLRPMAVEIRKIVRDLMKNE